MSITIRRWVPSLIAIVLVFMIGNAIDASASIKAPWSSKFVQSTNSEPNMLEILVVSSSTNEPVAGKRVWLQNLGGEIFTIVESKESGGGEHSSLITDSDGKVRFSLPRRRPITALVGDSIFDPSMTSRNVSARESRVVIQIVTGPPQPVSVRGTVVDALTAAPLSGASIKVIIETIISTESVERGKGTVKIAQATERTSAVCAATNTDEHGEFQLRVTPSLEQMVSVDLVGYHRVTVPMSVLKERSWQCPVAKLVKTEGRTVAFNQPDSNKASYKIGVYCSVGENTKGWPWIPSVPWSIAHTAFEASPGREYSLDLCSMDRIVISNAWTEVAVKLAPELLAGNKEITRIIDVPPTFSVGGDVKGRDGRPVPYCRVRFTPTLRCKQTFLRSLAGDSRSFDFVCDEKGGFRDFEIPRGRWYVGPSPIQVGSVGLCDLGKCFEVGSQSGVTQQCEVVATQGVRLRGRIGEIEKLDQQAGLRVYLTAPPVEGVLETEVQADGRFVFDAIDPMSSGEVWLTSGLRVVARSKYFGTDSVLILEAK